MKGFTINELSIGQEATWTKTITEADVLLFGAVSGDVNPAHFNEEYAKNTFFKGRIAHGMISAGLISAVLGVHMPGPGTIDLSQTLNFLAPVRIGDTITATGKVVEMIPEKNRVKIETICTNQDGTVVTKGEAMVMPPK